MWLAQSTELRVLLERQCGVLSRQQAVTAGLAPTVMDNQLRSDRWQRLQHGVYATFTGTPSRDAVLWAALLRAGPFAALSHQTAAELQGLTNQGSVPIHVTVPTSRRVEPISGVTVHHSRVLAADARPTASPPRTRVEDTVLDLTQTAASFDDAFGWLCRAVGRRLTTPDRLRVTLDGRSRARWRRELLMGLGDIHAGVRSPLERRYVTKVELAHGLPAAERQARVVIGGQHRYVDNLYEDALLVVELDGRAAHPAEQRWADSHRDNALAGLGMVTLHYNWHDVDARSCFVACEVAGLLALRGTVATLRRCGRTCPAAGGG